MWNPSFRKKNNIANKHDDRHGRMWSESTFRLKGQCRQKFEPLENLTKVFKFIFIPSVFIHKKKQRDRKD